MSTGQNIASGEQGPLDRDTLSIVKEHVGALAVSLEFEPETPSDDDLETAKRIGRRKGQVETIEKVNEILRDLFEASDR